MAQNNLELMRTLDDSWNTQDWETFEKRHSRDTAVFWPGQAEPTRGRDNHKAESIEFFKTFPDNHLINNRKSTRLNSSHTVNSYAVFCLKKKKNINNVQNSNMIRKSN